LAYMSVNLDLGCHLARAGVVRHYFVAVAMHGHDPRVSYMQLVCRLVTTLVFFMVLSVVMSSVAKLAFLTFFDKQHS